MPRGCEAEKAHPYRVAEGFYTRFMSGQGLDIGWRGQVNNPEPVLASAIGVDTDYPGYDGKTLPFPDESQDYVFASHSLEHIEDWKQAIQEWYRVVKVGGHLVICVPHQYLYEKKKAMPSRYCGDHKRFYTPSRIAYEIEESLTPNSYRIVHLCDRDDNTDYSIDANSIRCSDDRFEIECVVKKLAKPTWELAP